MSRSRRGTKMDGDSASSKKLSKSSTASTADFLQTEDRLTAVLLADSFTTKFRPLSLECPKVLMPIVNVPMIDYVLELLLSSNVQELIIFCSSHYQQIQQHCQQSKLLRRSQHSCHWRVITSINCFSTGDALRYLDTLDIIKSDFILISGDIVANINLQSVIEQHKANVKKDKNTLMTIALKQANNQHRSRSHDDDTVIALSPDTNQLLAYQNQWGAPSMKFPLQSFENHSEIEFHTDLMDTFIDICTPQVLLLCTDNFDYQSLRADFIPGILGQEDILGHTIYSAITCDRYAARIGDLHAYDAVSFDIRHRWSHPLTPDTNILGNNSSYHYYRGNQYVEDGVSIARESLISDDCVVAADTRIGSETIITRSIVGRNCIIGANVRITNSYLWDNVTIENNAVIDRAIIANGAIIRSGATIERGSIISYNVVIGENFTVKPYTKLTLVSVDDSVFEDDSPRSDNDNASLSNAKKKLVSDPTVVGVGGIGQLFVESLHGADDDEDEDTTASTAAFNTIALDSAEWKSAWRTKLASEKADESEDEWEALQHEEDNDAGEDVDEHIAANTTTGAANGAVDTLYELPRFFGEVMATLQRGITENLDVDAIVLEMAGLKMSHDASILEYGDAAFFALFSLLNNPQTQFHRLSLEDKVTWTAERRTAFDGTHSKAFVNSLLKLLQHWAPVLKKFCKQSEEQTIFLSSLVRACRRWQSLYGGVFGLVMRLLYDEDMRIEMIDEDAILKWERQFHTEHADWANDKLYQSAQPFLEWLKEAEEDDDEEDEDDSDEE